MNRSSNEDKGTGEFKTTVLFDNGVARVETHEIYGAIIRGAVMVGVVGGGPAFVPSDQDGQAQLVPGDISDLN